tara:strand:- start:4720 stop:5274 length:555 start_codon:yes stop_codon:yes gene_type:complete
MINSPERYNDTEILPTYLETSNLTIYSHGPIGTKVFKDFFKNTGTETTLGFVKPHHWTGLTRAYTDKTHVLVIRHPNDQHRHAAWLHGISIHEVNVKRENMFYHTHLAPHLTMTQHAEFDFYIRHDKLAQYIFDYEPPATPVYEGQLISQADELDAYYNILDNKMELKVPQWRDLIMRGQLETI